MTEVADRGEAVSITAAGGVLFRSAAGGDPDLLLIHRRGVWDLPKGKMEPGETVEECALREVAEEVNCPAPRILAPLGTTYHEYLEDGRRWGKTTYWFAMTASSLEGLAPEQEEGIREVRWMSSPEAGRYVGFENLSEVIERFQGWYREQR